MALATRCPHCHTTFRVAADQLKLRGGIVRCGTCQQVFDGNAALVDLDAGASTAPAAAPAPAASAPSLPPAPPAADSVTPVPDFDVPVFDPVPLDDGNRPPAWYSARGKQASDLPPSPPEPESSPDNSADPAGETFVALPEQNSLLRMPSSAPRASAGIPYSPEAAQQARNRSKKSKSRALTVPGPLPTLKPKLKPKTKPKPAALQIEHDEPAFVRQGRAREAGDPRRTRLLAGGCILLALALAAQLFVSGRDVIAASYPSLRPLAVGICAAFGCQVRLPTQIETLSIETGELQTLGNGAFTYTTLLRNQGMLVQAWPSLELTLHDANDKPLVRRVFAPRDYLGSSTGAAAAAGFAAHTEQAVKLSFQLQALTPSGYHIAIFYP